MKYHIAFSIIIALLLTSCKSRQSGSDLNYMQNIEKIATDAAAKTNATTLQPGDQLVILVSAKDLDVVKPFNQNYSSGEIIQQSQMSGNTPNTGNTTISGPTYTVDSQGNIDFPVIGKVNAGGKTTEEVRDQLTSKIKRYIINPTVNVRMANFKVTVLGEVNRPGPYLIADSNATILNALGMAGDLTMYGTRDNVLIVRNENGELSKSRINLLDANFLNSPYFNLKQGDVIYVSANETKEKTSKLDPNTNIYLSVAGVAIALAGIIVTVFKK